MILISLKAGGEGLNLQVAVKCICAYISLFDCVQSHVYLMDPWWNPASEAQVKNAHIYILICVVEGYSTRSPNWSNQACSGSQIYLREYDRGENSSTPREEAVGFRRSRRNYGAVVLHVMCLCRLLVLKTSHWPN